jgi:hypothetical protein
MASVARAMFLPLFLFNCISILNAGTYISLLYNLLHACLIITHIWPVDLDYFAAIRLVDIATRSVIVMCVSLSIIYMNCGLKKGDPAMILSPRSQGYFTKITASIDTLTNRSKSCQYI